MTAFRTTVTLDPDVAEQLKLLAHRRNTSFKVVLNNTIRAGLAAERGGGKPFKVTAHNMGLRPEIDLTHIWRLIDSLEDEEIIRKLQLGK